MISKKQATRYCKDDIRKIENYEQAINDKESLWVCHHRLELTLNGEFAHKAKELVRMGMYLKRPYFELIFMKYEEHRKMHWSVREFSEEHKKHLSEANKGKTNAKGVRSIFGKKFEEHYGITRSDDCKLYKLEYDWYRRHNNKCRWE